MYPLGTQIATLGVRFGALSGTTEGCIMMQPSWSRTFALNVHPLATQIATLGVRFGALSGTTEGCIMMQPSGTPPWDIILILI